MLTYFSRRRAAPEEKASRTARLVAVETAPQARWSPRDLTTFAREGYMQNPVVHGAVRLIADGVASLPLVAMRAGVEVPSHPALALLARPNPRDDRTSFVARLATHLLIAGNAYVERVDLDDVPAELHSLRPDRMRIVIGPDGWRHAYEYGIGPAAVTIRVNETDVSPILHVALFHPLDDHYGLSPLEAAARACDTHRAASIWNKALLDNAARPSGALVYRGPDGAVLTDEQFERLKGELEQTYSGPSNAGRPLLLEGGLDWVAMSLTPKDMDFQEARNSAAREIALAFGVPPVLLGIPGDATYANLQEANRALWRQAILPLAARIHGALGDWLGRAFGEPLTLVPDTDQVDALRVDRSALWKAVTDAPFLTLNEKRAALGYGPVEGGDATPDGAGG